MKFFVLFVICALISSLPMLSQVTEQPSGRLSGLFFIDYYHNTIRDENLEYLENVTFGGRQELHGFQIRRIYLTYDYRFNSKLSSRFRLANEDNFASGLNGNTGNRFSMFIKDARINWNYSEGHNVIIGIQPTPAFYESESIWGNRYIEKTIMDLRKIVSSRDLGVSFTGKIDSRGMLSYWIMYGNNNTGIPEDDKYRRFYANLGITPVNNLYIALYTDYQTRESLRSQLDDGETVSNNIITTAFFAGYNIQDKFSAGIELFFRTTRNGFIINNSYADRKGTGISVFSTYHFSEKINVFGRFDNFESNIHELAKGDTRNLIITGLAFKPGSNFILSPNIIVESYGNDNASNVRNSVTPRLTVSWIF
jgi:hypothetical protein